MKIALSLAIVLAVVGVSPAVSALDKTSSVAEILNQLGNSTKSQNYRGEFTYEHDGTIDMLRVVHAVIDGVEYERIYHLNGPEKSFMREGQSIDCVTAGNHLLRGRRLTLSSGRMVSIDQNYQFHMRGEERIAGREALILQLLPKDPYRYGMVLGVDKQTGLLTKAVITEGQKKVWERIQFVSLSLDDDMGIEAIYPDLATGKSSLAPLVESSMVDGSVVDDSVNTEAPASAEGSVIDNSSEASASVEAPANAPDQDCRQPSASKAPLQPAWVPNGFVLSDYSYSDEDGHMATYTDGLSVFSIFIGRVTDKPSQAVVRNGATVSLLTSVPSDNQFVTITVVGEVPAVTAHRVTQSLRVPVVK